MNSFDVIDQACNPYKRLGINAYNQTKVDAYREYIELHSTTNRKKKVYNHNTPYTSVSLCQEIIDSIPVLKTNKQAKVLILYAEEFIVPLRLQGIIDITLATQHHESQYANDQSRLGYKYLTLDEIQEQGMKFDVIVGNPPYENSGSEKFMKLAGKLLAPKGYVSLIVYAGPSTQPTKTKFRTEILRMYGFHNLTLLPTGTFKTYKNKDVLFMTMWFTAQQGYNGPTTIQRKGYDPVTTQLSRSGEPWYWYYSPICQSILDKALSYPKKMNVKWWDKKHPYQYVPCIHFCEKTSVAYVDWTAAATISNPAFGASVHTGIVSSDTATPTPEQLKSKRGYVITKYPDQVKQWTSSHLYGVLLTMITTTHDITKGSVGKMPLIELEEYSDEAAYDELNLTQQERNWLKSMQK